MSDSYVIGLLLVMLVALIVDIFRLKRKVQREREFLAYHQKAADIMGILIAVYDVRRDTLHLSRDCARLLRLDSTIKNFSQERVKANQQENHPLRPVLQCLDALSATESWRLVRRGEAPRCFHLHGYVLKDEEGRPRFIYGRFVDITQQQNVEARLAVKAQFDGLTRVHNSSAARSWLRQHLGQKPLAPGERRALILLDIDHFKQVNDSLGHQAGDRALVCVANALRQAFAGRGFIGRLGGDEFIGYLEEEDAPPEALEKLLRAIHRNCFELGQEAGLPIAITVSIGCALLGDEDYEAAYRKADAALYEAKKQGRNSHVIAPLSE